MIFIGTFTGDFPSSEVAELERADQQVSGCGKSERKQDEMYCERTYDDSDGA